MRLIGWFLGLTALVIGVWAIWGTGMEERFTLEGSTNYLNGAGSFAWLLGWGLLVADIVMPVPGTIVMSALGYIYGPILGGLFASMGSALAGLIAYGACRLLGERPAKFILGERDFERGHRWFKHGGGWLVCLSRALPILPEIVACTAGLVRMPFRRFIIALVCGSLPMGFVFAWVGAAGKDQPLLATILSLALPLVLWVAARLLMRRLEKHEEER